MGLVSPHPFPSDPQSYFPPNLRFPQVIARVCLLRPGRERHQRSLRTSWALQSFPWQLEGERRGAYAYCTLLCPFYTLWSSGLTPSKGQHHRYISTSKSCDHSTTFSYQRNTTFRGFQNHVARKKLSQLIPWLWSDLFVNRARKS